MISSSPLKQTISRLFLFGALLLTPLAPADLNRPMSSRTLGGGNYAILPALVVGNLLALRLNPPDRARWKGDILFDGTFRDGLRLKEKNDRRAVDTISDVLLFGVASYPFIIDAVGDAWLSERDPRTARELMLVASQALLFTGLVTQVVKTTTGRERPYAGECAGNPFYDDKCNDKDSRMSFFSGHASLAFTGAGFICASHEELNLWGGKGPCYAALGVATVVSLCRVMSDKHYTSDVLVGALIGLLSGYLIPKVAYYGSDPATRPTVLGQTSSEGVGFSIGFPL